MSRLFKFSLIFTIIFVLFLNCNYVFAAVDMNLNSNTSNNTSNTQNNSNTNNTNSTTNTTNTLSSGTSSFSTTVTTSDFDLQLTNILSICLIVVGVLLILLGIAIIIRLKK